MSGRNKPACGGKESAFTLVEIMIVVTIIALLVMIALPNFERSRKRAQAASVLEELRILNDAQDQYYMLNPVGAAAAGIAGLQPYIQTGSRLYDAFKANRRRTVVPDRFGNNYGSVVEDGVPKISIAQKTFTALSDVAPREFWEPYIASTIR